MPGSDANSPYPIILEPILVPKVWGGVRLRGYGKSIPDGVCIGESWEVADLPRTSDPDQGHAAARSRIVNGSLAGATLHDAMRAWTNRLLGAAEATPGGDFPLLVKLLDAREHLSVQVHPSDAYAAAHHEAHLKTECWYILDAERVAGREPVLFVGLKRHVKPERWLQALRAGDASGVVELLEQRPARVGDCHELPSGTPHALGAGVLVAEVQTPSDTTFRIYDWNKEFGRPARAMHVTQAAESTIFDDPPPPVQGSAFTRFFELTSVTATRGLTYADGDPPGCAVVMAIGDDSKTGTVVITSPDFEPVKLAKGQTAVVPACLVERAMLQASEACRALLIHPRTRTWDIP